MLFILYLACPASNAGQIEINNDKWLIYDGMCTLSI